MSADPEKTETWEETPPAQTETPTDPMSAATLAEFRALKNAGMNAKDALAQLQQKKPATSLVMLFAEALSAYPTEREARSHRVEIARELGCADSLIYKALKKIDKFKTHKTEYQEATVKFSQPAEIPINNQETDQPANNQNAGNETPPPTIQPQPPQIAPQVSMIKPLDETAVAKTLKLATKALASLAEFEEFGLNQEECDDLAAVWTPILREKAPQIAQNPYIMASITTATIVLPKVMLYRRHLKKLEDERKKNEQVIPAQPPAKPPTPPDLPPTPAQTPQQEPPIQKAKALM